MTAALVPLTESMMLDALHHRYSETVGNGRRYVVAEMVRSGAGFDARRTADFVAVDTWRSSGFERIGHEIKVTRADWRREMKDPSKAAEFTPYMHRWYIVAADDTIVRPGELPTDWGLLIMTSRGLRQIRKPWKNKAALDLSESRTIALMRAVQATAAARGLR